jgi:hypothetical protein
VGERWDANRCGFFECNVAMFILRNGKKLQKNIRRAKVIPDTSWTQGRKITATLTCSTLEVNGTVYCAVFFYFISA